MIMTMLDANRSQLEAEMWKKALFYMLKTGQIVKLKQWESIILYLVDG